MVARIKKNTPVLAVSGVGIVATLVLWGIGGGTLGAVSTAAVAVLFWQSLKAYA